MQRFLALASLPLVIAACTDSAGPAPAAAAETILGHCVYTNRFSKQEECREYHGSAWTEAAITEDCTSQEAEVKPGACGYADTLGACVLQGEPDKTVHLVFPGTDAALCADQKLGCEVFAKGTFVGSATCGDEPDGPPNPTTPVFRPPVLTCKNPLPGEPAGMSEDGKVCTWEMISGCTEPGRKFTDYASCERVYTQRPYYPSPPAGISTTGDARLEDPAYAAELKWVTEQAQASACVCCHATSAAPQGAAIWNIEAEGNWVNTFSPYGLAFAGGFIDSSLFGAYPPSENNGFSRDETGIPSTDPARMAAFFEKELAHRGSSPAEFADMGPQPPFFYDQVLFKPEACKADNGIAADMTIRWSGGGARYVYVMEASAKNPGVPPNLDLPEGTIWRLDVPPEDAPLVSGEVRFGEVPKGKLQAYPESEAPSKLEPNKTYYLYVDADVMVPITRCLFTYQGM